MLGLQILQNEAVQVLLRSHLEARQPKNLPQEDFFIDVYQYGNVYLRKLNLT